MSEQIESALAVYIFTICIYTSVGFVFDFSSIKRFCIGNDGIELQQTSCTSPYAYLSTQGNLWVTGIFPSENSPRNIPPRLFPPRSIPRYEY